MSMGIITDTGLENGIIDYLNRMIGGRVYSCSVHNDGKTEYTNPKFIQIGICVQRISKKEVLEFIGMIYTGLHLDEGIKYELEYLSNRCYSINIRKVDMKQVVKIYTVTKMMGTYDGDGYYIKWEI